jgi:hypothetical protein
VLLGAALAAGGAAAASAIWWWGRAGELLSILRRQQVSAESLPLVERMNEPGLLFYGKLLPWCCSPWLLAAAALAVVALVGYGQRTRRPRAWLRPPDLLLVWAWLLGGLAVLSALRYHFLRFLLPLAPALALITALGLLAIPWSRARRAVVGLVLAVAAGTWAADSLWMQRPLLFGWTRDREDIARHAVTSGPPGRDPVLVIVDELARTLRRAHGDGRGVGVLLDHHPNLEAFRFFWVSSATLRARLNGIQILGVTYVEHGSAGPLGSSKRIGGAHFPDLRDPLDHCYLLAFSPRRPSAGDPGPGLPARLVADRLVLNYREDPQGWPTSLARFYQHHAPLRVRLWALSECRPGWRKLIGPDRRIIPNY